MRLLTALSILCICGVTSFWGWHVATFAQARAASSSTGAGMSTVLASIGVPALTAEVNETLLRQGSIGTSEPPLLRLVRMNALLAVRPLLAQMWLSLAEERLVLGRPATEILAALRMSWITGPNEGSTMWRRGVLGMMEWETLPSDARRLTIADLVGAMAGGAADDQEVGFAKSVLLHKSSEAQAEIASALHVAGLSVSNLTRIGLVDGSG